MSTLRYLTLTFRYELPQVVAGAATVPTAMPKAADKLRALPLFALRELAFLAGAVAEARR